VGSIPASRTSIIKGLRSKDVTPFALLNYLPLHLPLQIFYPAVSHINDSSLSPALD